MNAIDKKTSLEKKFPLILKDKVRIEGERRIWVDAVAQDEFMQILSFAITELGFDTFHMTTGLDCDETFEVLYILSDADKTILVLRQCTLRQDPVIVSVNSFFPNSLFHERELEDLFGIKVLGLPSGPRYPLPDNWPEGQFPLRKDWNPEYFNKKTFVYEPLNQNCSEEAVDHE